MPVVAVIGCRFTTTHCFRILNPPTAGMKVKHMNVEILPTNRKHVPVEVVEISDTKNHSENEKKNMKRRIKKKIKVKDQYTGERGFLNVPFHDFYTPPSIIYVIKLRGKRGRGTWHS